MDNITTILKDHRSTGQTDAMLSFLAIHRQEQRLGSEMYQHHLA